jgi:hypothetical protein
LLRLLAVPADVASLPVRTDLVHWPDASAFFEFNKQQQKLVYNSSLLTDCEWLWQALIGISHTRFATSAAPEKPKVHFCQCAATNFILTCEVVAVEFLRNDRKTL